MKRNAPLLSAVALAAALFGAAQLAAAQDAATDNATDPNATGTTNTTAPLADDAPTTGGTAPDGSNTAAASASAESAPEPAPVDPVAQLAAPDYAVREAALEVLLTNDALTPELIAGWIRDRDRNADPETYHRLLGAMHHHALRRFAAELTQPGDPASLGIQHRPRPAGAVPGIAGPAVLVAGTLPGFPAHGVLRTGDLIIRFADEDVAEPAEGDGASFGKFIQQHHAGETVSIQVLRNGKPVTLAITLGSIKALQKIYTAQQPRVQGAFALRWEALRTELLEAEADPQP